MFSCEMKKKICQQRSLVKWQPEGRLSLNLEKLYRVPAEAESSTTFLPCLLYKKIDKLTKFAFYSIKILLETPEIKILSAHER